MTKAKPQIFFLPKTHNDQTKELLNLSDKEIDGNILLCLYYLKFAYKNIFRTNIK